MPQVSSSRRDLVQSIKVNVDRLAGQFQAMTSPASYETIVAALRERAGIVSFLRCANHGQPYMILTRLDGSRCIACPACVQEIASGAVHG